MNGFRIRIAISELMGDKWTTLADYDESCKKENLKKTLKKLNKLLENFIEENNIGIL